MPLALIPAGLLEPLPGRDAEHQNDPIAFSKRKWQRTAVLNILRLFLQHQFLTQLQVARQKNVQQSVNTQVQLCKVTAEG